MVTESRLFYKRGKIFIKFIYLLKFVIQIAKIHQVNGAQNLKIGRTGCDAQLI